MRKNTIKILKTVAAFSLAVCIVVSITACGFFKGNKYAGQGFDYMNGYSSTDFKDYMVYSNNSKLAALDHPSSFTIDAVSEMPIMDGAEACYPLYAAFAKAVYKDIDVIEKDFSNSAEYKHCHCNGRIVTFTNTIEGFDRLVYGDNDPEKLGGSVDLFFGARPSESQLFWANEMGVELTITPIGREAFVFFVEADNPIDNLTADQVKAIYHGDITNWKELGGKNEKIIAFQRPEDSGSQTMMEYFMDEVTLKEPMTYETIDSMIGIVSRVAQYTNEKGAMGYSFRYFLEGLNQEKGIKILSIDGISPSIENIENGSYPLIVDVCLITRANDQNPNVQKMIDFVLSEDGQDILRKTGYAPISVMN